MSTATLDAPEQATAPAVEHPEQVGSPAVPLVRQVLTHLGTVGCFLGAVLVGEGVVHRPVEPSRSTALVLAGLVVCLLATAVREVLLADQRPARARLLRLLGTSLLLSSGLGTLSAGVLHLSDARGWSEGVLAAGLVLSWLAVALRTGQGLRRTAVSSAVVLVVAGLLAAGLSRLPRPAEDDVAPTPAVAVVPTEEGHPAEVAPAPAAPAPDLDASLAELARLQEQLAALTED